MVISLKMTLYVFIKELILYVVFVIWDIDNNGLIDSLELFSGLILFSETKFEDKARCKTFINLDIYHMILNVVY